MSDQVEQLYERLLVMRCQVGDEGAFRELVERYSPRLRYYLDKSIPNRDRVEDLLQEVWLDVFRQLPRLQAAGAFKAWIYRIVRGKVVLELRRNGRPVRTNECVEQVVSPQADERQFTAEDAARVHPALDRLVYEHREVLVLRFLEDLSYEEIAQVVGCPVGTVRSRIHYAKQAIGRLLDDGQAK
jgi:RNA polymerase sigma-70 factor, ECF subfamily